ncbi:MAG TPA: 3-oxoacyl-[acyl-carrier-protein] synthase III C-terminal domain-containing protein [Myxococcaceae bacterium]|nr:3-oxoacyl-[acyl-carrier-protein] synthase III C-terminal domain-containing protein [Myxococcaceae bacterium]
MSFDRNAREGLSTVSEIVASGYAYPSEVVDNAAYFERCRFPIDDRETLAAESGFRSRRWCSEGENTWTLAREAVRRALAQDPLLRDELDLVLVSSGTTFPVIHPPEPSNPGMADLAPLVLRELGRTGALGLDLKACYCTGFLRGLQVADGLLQNANYRAALVVSTEQGSRLAVAETNRTQFAFLAGDAAGAVVLRKRPRAGAKGIVDYWGQTEGDKLEWIGVGADGRSFINLGSRAGRAAQELLIAGPRHLLARNGLTPRDVRWLLPLQTHARLVEGLRQATEFPREKLLWFGDVNGMSGSASIPSCLAEQREKGVVRKGDLVLATAVGAGLNAAAALFYA